MSSQLLSKKNVSADSFESNLSKASFKNPSEATEFQRIVMSEISQQGFGTMFGQEVIQGGYQNLERR